MQMPRRAGLSTSTSYTSLACVAGVRRGGKRGETSEPGKKTRAQTHVEREKGNKGRVSLPLARIDKKASDA